MNKVLNAFLVASCLVFIISCKNESVEKKAENISELNKVDVPSNKNDEELRKLTVDFFNWYHSNMNRLNKIEYLKGGYVSETDSSAYYIDEDKAAEYLKEIDKSGFVSRSYMKRLKTHLLFVSNELKTEKVYDGVITGLDHDLISKSQDDEEIFSNISKIKLLKHKVISKNEVENYYELMPNSLFLKISFTLEDKWKIEDYEYDYKIE